MRITSLTRPARSNRYAEPKRKEAAPPTSLTLLFDRCGAEDLEEELARLSTSKV